MLVNVATELREKLGEQLFEDHNVFLERFEDALKDLGRSSALLTAKLIVNAVSWRDENAAPVVKKVHKPGKAQPDPLRGLFEAEDRRQDPRRRIRARQRTPRLRANPAAGGRRHRSLHPPRSPALHARRLDRRGRHQDRLRSQLHPPLLPAACSAPSPRSAPTSSRWSRRPKACSTKSLAARKPESLDETRNESA